MENSNEINTDKNQSRSLNKRKTDINPINKFTFNSYEFQKELIFFKNEILKDIHDFETKQDEKLVNYIQEQTKIINLYEENFIEQNQKITYLSNMIQDSFKKEKFEEYFAEFNTKFNNNLSQIETKIYRLQNDIKFVLNQQEKNFREHIFYPGKIGPNYQFKDLHAFIDFVLDSIKQLGTYQDILKSYEIHKIKNNIEKDLKTMQLQIKNNFYSLTKFITDKINQSEQKMLNNLQNYNTQFVDVRLENNQHANDLQKKMNEVSNNFEQILTIRKDINLKNKEQDKKFENIIQNMEESENKIIEQKKEINNIDTKFNLLTTYIDNQNAENINDNHSSSKNLNNIKSSRKTRIQSAKDFIDTQLRLISKGIIPSKDIINNNRTLSESKINNSEFNDNYDNDNRTLNVNKQHHKKSLIMNKKYSFRGESFIKGYITGKISLGEMYNHPSEVFNKNNNNDKIKNETNPLKINHNLTPINDNTNILDITRLQSILENIKNNKLNINNIKSQKNKFILKSLSDGNYFSRNSKLVNKENFMKEIFSITERKNIFNQVLSPLKSYQKIPNYKLLEQQLNREKKYGKKRNKLLIIQ